MPSAIVANRLRRRAEGCRYSRVAYIRVVCDCVKVLFRDDRVKTVHFIAPWCSHYLSFGARRDLLAGVVLFFAVSFGFWSTGTAPGYLARSLSSICHVLPRQRYSFNAIALSFLKNEGRAEALPNVQLFDQASVLVLEPEIFTNAAGRLTASASLSSIRTVTRFLMKSSSF